MLTPAQNYDHLLDPISGYNGMHDLQFAGYTVDGTNWHRGALMSLAAGGLLTPGLTTLHAMAMWAINASYDFDVAGGVAWGAGAAPLYRSDAGNIAGQTLAANGTSVLRRHIGCFVATGGFELCTTEFNPLAVYAENDPLKPHTVTGAEAVGSYPAGWVTKGTILAGGELALEEAIVGVVSSRQVTTEVYRQSVLRFWPVYQPARLADGVPESSSAGPSR